ncbi:iron complex outermembrane recepter protein [Duganella sp. CF517]|uniref:TonB-dependent receptor n=1 Tax=Duganella sp. CF517 TaxID=1881038 RepID=UPI0008CE5EA6|nr:TonB-dependent receptor [Duganella sp. CF517]SEN23755.1 iron complex outermembrane recepter protein [Duganella sp. CF517]
MKTNQEQARCGRKAALHTLARSIAVAFAGSAAVPLGALAQDDIQKVVVTAQSRAQSAQEVPISMEVVTAKDIRNLGARNLGDLNGYLPGLEVEATQPTQPVFGIRGVQAGDFGIGTDMPVGIYVDGVYTGKTGGALMNFIDIQRVEVLKGPQGTLFGRNSAAGAISVVTNEPDQALDMNGHLKIGEYGRVDADAMLNVPLAENTAARLVFVRAESDGWARNATTGDRTAGDKSWAARLSLKQKISDATLNLTLEHEQLRQKGWPAFGVVKDPALPFAGFTGIYDAAYVANFVDPRKARLENDTAGSERRTFDGASLRAELPLGGLTLRSITAYRTFSTYNLTDNDGGARAGFSLANTDQKKAYNWQQEFKLSGKTRHLDWIAGASFYDNRERQSSTALLNTATLDNVSLLGGGNADLANLFGALGQAGIPGVDASSNFPWGETTHNYLRTRAFSVYQDVIWHATPSTNLTLGLRWSRDRKNMEWHVPGRESPALDALLNTYGPLAGLDASALPSNQIFYAAGQLAATPVHSTKSWTDWSPRLVLDHKLTPDLLLFASLSKGYQAGGFNVFTPPNAASPNAKERDPSYDPEKMTNLEVGFKLYAPSIKATLNGSVFAYRFKNLQDIKLGGTGPIPTYNVVNSDQQAKGLDLDGRIRVSPNLTLFAGLELIDQTYKRYRTTDDSGAALDLSGQTVGTPTFNGMGGVNASWEALGGRISSTLQGTYQSKARCNDDTRALQCLHAPAVRTGEARSKADFRLGWDNANGKFGIALLVNNLFDKQYVHTLDGQTKPFGLPYAIVTPPRTIALELRGSL